MSEDIHFENAEMRIASVSHTSTQAGLSRAVMLDNSHKSEGDVVLRSARVTKRAIKDARVAFAALLNDLEVSEGVKRNDARLPEAHRVDGYRDSLCD